jgi:REP element-mobilizing transposase RayT
MCSPGDFGALAALPSDAMARLPRYALADGRYFHVFARGVDHLAIFRDDDDRLAFLGLLVRVIGLDAWRTHAFCLMDTHVHLVVEAPLTRISKGMQRLLGTYAQRFNQRHGRVGHLFGDRFGARVIDSESYLGDVVEYVLLNPVRAGMTDSAADWPWSAARFSLR